MEPGSEIARIRKLIQEEYDAARQDVQGLALGTAKHQYMTARQENIAGYLKQLSEKYGDAVADQAMIDLG